MLEGIYVDSGVPTKSTSQVILSSFETNVLIKYFRFPSENLQTYFGLSLSWVDPSGLNDNGSDEDNRQSEMSKRLQRECYKQLNLNVGNELIKKTLMYNMTVTSSIAQQPAIEDCPPEDDDSFIQQVQLKHKLPTLTPLGSKQPQR